MKYSVHSAFRPNEDFAYLYGLIIGDGSLPKGGSVRPNGKKQKRSQIYFVSDSEIFIKETYLPLFKKVFGLMPYYSLIKGKKNPLYFARIESKEAYELFLKYGFKNGKKSFIAEIPSFFPKKLHKYFLAGLLDTDGGKKGNSFGLTTASFKLDSFFINFLKKKKISFHSCPWKYNEKIYYQTYVKRNEAWKLLKYVPLKNKGKIEFIKSLPR